MAAKKATTLDPVILAAVKAARDLESLDVRYALVGGLGVSARGEPRYTRDVDLAIAVSRDDEAEALVPLTVSGGATDAAV